MTNYNSNINKKIKSAYNSSTMEYNAVERATTKIYEEVWTAILAQFENDKLHCESYMYPLALLEEHRKNDSMTVDYAVKTLLKDGFYTKTDSNIQALFIDRKTILHYARRDLLQKIYFKIWDFVVMQAENNCEEAYVWLEKDDNNSLMLYCHVGEEVFEEAIEALDETEIKEIEETLKNDGFEINRAPNGNLLMTIASKEVHKPIQKR